MDDKFTKLKLKEVRKSTLSLGIVVVLSNAKANFHHSENISLLANNILNLIVDDMS